MAKKKAAKPTVKSILKELKAEVNKGLGKKKMSPPARKYWVELYTKAISDRLAKGGDAGGDWASARKRVLKAAKKLGAVARVLTDGKHVSKVTAQLASDTIARYPGCPGPGSGEWCPPAGEAPGQ